MTTFRCDMGSKELKGRVLRGVLAAGAAAMAVQALAAPAFYVGLASDVAKAYQATFGRFIETTVGQYIYQSIGSKLIWLGGGKGYLIVPAKNVDDSHVSSGTLAVAYLHSEGERLVLDRKWLEAGGGSTWGIEPEFSLSSKFGANPMIFTEGGGTWQGCTSSVAQLIELRPNGPKVVAQFVTYFGSPDGQEIKGQIINIKPETSFDVKYSGNTRTVERYVKLGGTYRLRTGKTKVETC